MPRDAHAREPDPIGALRPDRFQRREWAALRVARWTLIAGLAAAGLGGFRGRAAEQREGVVWAAARDARTRQPRRNNRGP